MAKIGILSDIHGDLDSLEKAFCLFSGEGVESIICAGDLVEKGQHHDEVVARVVEEHVSSVQGNHDENAVRHDRLSGIQSTAGEAPLQAKTIAFLRSLPHILELNFAGVSLLVAHATPSENAGRVFHIDGSMRLSKRFKKDLARTDCQIVIVGHTHSPFDIEFRDKRIINPGSTCKLKRRDSHTAGVLEMPSGTFTVFDLNDGSRCDVQRGRTE